VNRARILPRELPTFSACGHSFYKRLTLIAKKRRITKVFYPIAPDKNAAEVLDGLARAAKEADA